MISLPIFHRLIRWGDYVISDYCLRLHKELMREIQDKNNGNIITIDELGPQFATWLRLVGVTVGSKGFNVAGANFAGFDGLFLKKVPNFPPWFYRVIDVGSMYFQKDKDRLPGLGDIAPHTNEHRALPDAMSVVGAIRRKFWPHSYPNKGGSCENT